MVRIKLECSSEIFLHQADLCIHVGVLPLSYPQGNENYSLVVMTVLLSLSYSFLL